MLRKEEMGSLIVNLELDFRIDKKSIFWIPGTGIQILNNTVKHTCVLEALAI